ncbi:MAG: sulfonate ABC transporter substrate-binding protein [Hydrococcus sp. RU_2_2]|nr:sulfonate ABC transporter substrate-binding protein [Hydrococcus sp. RU_2_2]NJP21811.1 sulfonate ABC transporter substrate-binding protein [Hydrococcus sp. CRU_1_1]
MQFGNLLHNSGEIVFFRLKSVLKKTRLFAFLFALGFGLSIALSACTTTINNPTQNGEVIRLGYQKFGTLNILKARGNLEKRFQDQNISVQWTQFPAGPQLLEALNTGSIDFGHTGEAPPIFAQAAGAPLEYVASQTPNPKGEGILVSKDSPIKTVADLKGKKVVLNKGSNVHFFLVKAVEKAGLKYEDIEPVFLPPADARAAFEQGSVDAWAIWDPFYTAAKRATDARVLVDGEGIVANREFYLAAKPFVAKYPKRVKAILEETEKADVWAKSNIKEAATLLSPQLGIDVATLEEVLQRSPVGIQPIKPDVVAYQQQVADTFYQLKLLPEPVRVEEVAQVSNE